MSTLPEALPTSQFPRVFISTNSSTNYTTAFNISTYSADPAYSNICRTKDISIDNNSFTSLRGSTSTSGQRIY